MTSEGSESAASRNGSERGADPAEIFFDAIVAPLTERFEAKRVAAVADYKRRIPYGLAVFAAVLVIVGMLVFGERALLAENPMIALILVGVAGMIAYAWVTAPLRAYIEDVRGEIYPRIFSFFGDEFVYSHDCPWSVSSLEDSDLIPSYDDESLEDYVRGVYKTVSVEMVEALLTEERGSGKNRKTVTTFDGVLFVLTPKKRFSGRIVVKRDSGMIANTVRGFFKDKFQGLETVRLEDPEFERLFEVYATDQIEARTILTTSFMERLMALSRLFGDGEVDCSFFDDRLLIRLSTSKDFFRPASAHEPVDFRRDFRTIVAEMQIVFDIVDVLKLDQDIGL